jgi:hypothetical protein
MHHHDMMKSMRFIVLLLCVLTAISIQSFAEPQAGLSFVMGTIDTDTRNCGAKNAPEGYLSEGTLGYDSRLNGLVFCDGDQWRMLETKALPHPSALPEEK